MVSAKPISIIIRFLTKCSRVSILSMDVTTAEKLTLVEETELTRSSEMKITRRWAHCLSVRNTKKTHLFCLEGSTKTTICNVTQCRATVGAYISSNRSYDTTTISDCQGCPRASYPNFPDWSSLWRSDDFYVRSIAGADIAGNPRNGTLATCQALCLTYTVCFGFSREKAANDSDTLASCYLKNNLTSSIRTVNDPVWQTILFIGSWEKTSMMCYPVVTGQQSAS